MPKKEEEVKALLDKSEHDYFFGYEALEQKLVQRLTSSKLHHSWLIEGLEGIGKATLAWRLARFLLASEGERKEGLSIDKSSQAWNLTRAHSHPDFLYLAPAEDSKTQSITIGEIRAINDFFTRSPALSTYRVAIIDAVDNMNVNAANGLLKLLEEPPAHGIIFLISHRSGSVLATIRSRCQRLKLPPLDEEAIGKGLQTFLPELTQEETKLAIRLSGGSLGKALSFASADGIVLYKDFHAIIKDINHLDHNKIQKFCSTITGDRAKYDLFCGLILDWSHSIATKTDSIEKGLTLWAEVSEVIKTTERLNMDKKLAAQNMFLALEKLAA
jgi:DNA polymerase-3 subunit delta'